MGAWGLRRALFDLAFGYVSGFPVRDIVPFVLLSLLPRSAREAATDVESVPVQGDAVVGTVHVMCPECGTLMPATVSAEIVDEAGDGQAARLICTPDMSDIHAHVWSHGERAS